jgi:hypothetical protein
VAGPPKADARRRAWNPDVRHPLPSAVDLFRSRWWTIGWGVAPVAFALHVAALTLAPISIGQAVLAGGLVFLAVLAERFFGFELASSVDRDRPGLQCGGDCGRSGTYSAHREHRAAVSAPEGGSLACASAMGGRSACPAVAVVERKCVHANAVADWLAFRVAG